eukprot:scaffold29976_cov94-Skeletonema_marinoi.AAC.1
MIANDAPRIEACILTEIAERKRRGDADDRRAHGCQQQQCRGSRPLKYSITYYYLTMDNHHQTLTRRATATDEDIINFLQRQPSLPEDNASPAELPDTSHKRKQSDVANIGNLNIGQSDLRATFELERIEQGVEEEEDDHSNCTASILFFPPSN